MGAYKLHIEKVREDDQSSGVSAGGRGETGQRKTLAKTNTETFGRKKSQGKNLAQDKSTDLE